MIADPASEWHSLSPRDIATLFSDFPGRWCIAGGWAIDLFLGHQTREHADVDVLVFHDDLQHLHPFLAEWELFGASSGELLVWEADSVLSPGTHDVWCRRNGGPWEFQLMVIESTLTAWMYRRDTRLRGPIDDLSLISACGLPFLAPEIQLLYKSRTPRPKDESDFEAILPMLDQVRRTWLIDALRLTDPTNPWLARLVDW